VSWVDDLLAQVPRRLPQTAEEERRLALGAQSGDKSAAKELSACNIRLVVKIARGFGSADSFEDLVQEGMVGLMLAIRKFDPDLGRFRPYAAKWIRAHVRLAADRERARGERFVLLEDAASSAPSPEEEYLRAEAGREAALAVKRARGGLTPREDLVFRDRTMAGKSQAKIGAAMGRSRENVRKIHIRSSEKVALALRADWRRSRSGIH